GARHRCRRHQVLDRLRPRLGLLHRLRFRAARSGGAAERSAGRRRPLRRAADAAWREAADSCRGLCGLDRARRLEWRQPMSAPLILGVPAKGRLQENAEQFFALAGMKLVKPRGARDYRGAVAGMPGIEVAYLSASEIADALNHGGIHLGVTG